MGWDPRELGRPQFLMLGTQGGIPAAAGHPIALGYHTGHWEISLLMQAPVASPASCAKGLPTLTPALSVQSVQRERDRGERDRVRGGLADYEPSCEGSGAVFL